MDEEFQEQQENLEPQQSTQPELRGQEEPEKKQSQEEFARELARILEGIIFASPDPLRIKEIQEVLKNAEQFAGDENVLHAARFASATATQIDAQLRSLASQYDAEQRGFRLQEGASGWHVATQADLSLWVRQLFPELRPARLTPAALETLAIVAYRQPLTRSDLEAVRGVSSDGPMQTLLDRGMVKIAGRAEQPGRPLLYETTTHFLEHFGLKSLSELPNAAELGDLLQKTQEQQEKMRQAQKEREQQQKEQSEAEAREESPEEAAREAIQQDEPSTDEDDSPQAIANAE
jgi:segregation and condensation protein B